MNWRIIVSNGRVSEEKYYISGSPAAIIVYGQLPPRSWSTIKIGCHYSPQSLSTAAIRIHHHLCLFGDALGNSLEDAGGPQLAPFPLRLILVCLVEFTVLLTPNIELILPRAVGIIVGKVSLVSVVRVEVLSRWLHFAIHPWASVLWASLLVVVNVLTVPHISQPLSIIRVFVGVSVDTMTLSHVLYPRPFICTAIWIVKGVLSMS